MRYISPISSILVILLALLPDFATPAKAEPHVLKGYQLDEVIDLANLSEAAYDSTVTQKKTAGWNVIDADAEISGLRWRLTEQHTKEGKRVRVLAFAGTEIPDLRDWLTDINQATSSSVVPPAQYRRALQLVQKQVRLADQNPNLEFIVTGHSLGGGIAQYVAIKTGIRAVVFNAAALGPGSVDNIGLQLTGAVGQSRMITNVHLLGDPVYEGTQNIGGKQFGDQYVIEEAPGTPGILPYDRELMVEVSKAEKAASALARHDMKNLFTALEFERAYGDSLRQARIGMNALNQTDKSVPIWWAAHSPKHQLSSDYASVDLLNHMSRHVKRVTVAGRGHGADRLYQQMVSRLGNGNVQRLISIGEPFELRRRAVDFKPDVILAVRPDTSISLGPHERLAVPIKVAEHFGDAIATTASALHELRTYYKVSDSIPSKILHSQWLDPGSTKLSEKGLGGVRKFYSMASAIQDDIEATGDGRFVLMRSKTMDVTMKIALNKALKRVIADLAEKGVFKKGTPDFGGFELVYGLERVSRHRQVDITAIEHGLDALVGLTWGALGWVVSSGNTGVASAYQEIGQSLAGIGRASTQGLFNSLQARLRHDVEQHVEDWRTRQELNLKQGKPVQRIEEYFGEKEVKRMGISDQHLNVLNDQYLLYVRQQGVCHPALVREVSIEKPTPTTIKKFDELVPDSTYRVVVVGHGGGPDGVYAYAVKRFGPDNVKRVYSSLEHYRVRRVAGEFGASVILDANSQSNKRLPTKDHGGISMRMIVNEQNITTDKTGQLNQLKKDALSERTDGDSLFWQQKE